MKKNGKTKTAEAVVSKKASAPKPTKEQRTQARGLVLGIVEGIAEKHPRSPIARQEVVNVLAEKMSLPYGTARRAAGFGRLRRTGILQREGRGLYTLGERWAERATIGSGSKRAAKPKADKPTKTKASKAEKPVKGSRASKVNVDVKAEAARLQKAHAAKSRAALAQAEAAPAAPAVMTAQDKPAGA